MAASVITFAVTHKRILDPGVRMLEGTLTLVSGTYVLSGVPMPAALTLGFNKVCETVLVSDISLMSGLIPTWDSTLNAIRLYYPTASGLNSSISQALTSGQAMSELTTAVTLGTLKMYVQLWGK